MKDNHFDVLVIGGGASGFFAAVEAAEGRKIRVGILEKSNKFLAKVKISGGGRCNVTNACFDKTELSKNYPRGEKQLRKAFYQFDAQSTLNWFEQRGLTFYTQEDNCIFPKSNNSQSIIDCLMHAANKNGVEMITSCFITSIEENKDGFELATPTEKFYCKKLILATGGTPKLSGFDWLKNLNIDIVEPVPSLFTFNMPGNAITELMGNVVVKTTVKLESTKLVGDGPLLITHWGMSGPAILKLSAFGARILADKNYDFAILVNWLNDIKETALLALIQKVKAEHGSKKILNLNPFPFTNRLFEHLLKRSKISDEARWKDINGKSLNQLMNTLLNDRFEVKGKTTFKEEFVTAGGIDLNQINFQTMEFKSNKNLLAVGELLDIDGITGGFNFQAAWTTGYIAGKSARESLLN